MLEEKNDNLLEADGSAATNLPETIQTEVLEELDTVETSNEEITEQVEEVPQPSPTENRQSTSTIIDAIADTNAEESEDETLKERHDIPMLNYEALPLESLVDELKKLVTNEKVMSIKDHVEEIKKSFLAKYYHLLEEKKRNFLPKTQIPLKNFNTILH